MIFPGTTTTLNDTGQVVAAFMDYVTAFPIGVFGDAVSAGFFTELFGLKKGYTLAFAAPYGSCISLFSIPFEQRVLALRIGFGEITMQQIMMMIMRKAQAAAAAEAGADAGSSGGSGE